MKDSERQQMKLETEAIVAQGEADVRQFRIDEQVRAIIAQSHSIFFTDDAGIVSFLDANGIITRAYDIAEMAERERARRMRIGADAVELALRERGYLESDDKGGPVEVLADA